MTVICEQHETGWQLSVTYMRQVGGYLSDTRVRMTALCQLHEARCRLSVRYMRQDDGYLLAT